MGGAISLGSELLSSVEETLSLGVGLPLSGGVSLLSVGVLSLGSLSLGVLSLEVPALGRVPPPPLGTLSLGVSSLEVSSMGISSVF